MLRYRCVPKAAFAQVIKFDYTAKPYVTNFKQQNVMLRYRCAPKTASAQVIKLDYNT